MNENTLSKLGEEDLSYLFSLRAVTESATLDFWIENLFKYSLESGKLVLSVEEIISAFTRDGIVPGFFDQTAKELTKQKHLSILEDMIDDTKSDLVTYLISSLWSAVFDEKKNSSNQKLISTQLVDQIESFVCSYAKNLPPKDLGFSKNTIVGFDYNFKDFLEKACSCSTVNDAALWISWVQQLNDSDIGNLVSLMTKRGILISDEKSIKVITDASNPSTNNVSGAFLDIRLSLHDISRRLILLNKKIDSYTHNAVSAKARSDSSTALMYLKLRKNSQSTQQRLLQAQYSLEECLQNMEGSEINAIVVGAYTTASRALMTMRKESGVTVESVEIAMENFEEEMDQMQEIGDVMLSSNTATITEEEKELLENELHMLFEQDTPKILEVDIIESLPVAPSTIPISSTKISRANEVEQNLIAS